MDAGVGMDVEPVVADTGVDMDARRVVAGTAVAAADARAEAAAAAVCGLRCPGLLVGTSPPILAATAIVGEPSIRYVSRADDSVRAHRIGRRADCGGDGGRPPRDSSARLASQSHFATGNPCAIQSTDLTPGGGFTHSAAKCSMSTKRTILASGSHFDRPAAFDWMA